MFGHKDYINLVLKSGQFVTHDYSYHSVQKDPQMMAFYDSLVQRDIEGWTSDSSESNDGESSFFELCWNRSINSDDSSNSSANNSDNEELVHDLNSHYFRYLEVISKRIGANELKPNTNCQFDIEMVTTSTLRTVDASRKAMKFCQLFRRLPVQTPMTPTLFRAKSYITRSLMK